MMMPTAQPASEVSRSGLAASGWPSCMTSSSSWRCWASRPDVLRAAVTGVLGDASLLVFFLLRSVRLTVARGWSMPNRLEAGAAAGFIGMLLIPLALTAAFLGAALLQR